MAEKIVGRIGRIVAGDELGRFVKIVNDSENTGGFLILTADDAEFRNCHDNWVEDEVGLERYFQESGWFIEWIE